MAPTHQSGAMLDPEKFERDLRKKAAVMFEDWARLAAILDRHEATIRERWKNGTRNERVVTLLAAWPNMPASHRPDFAAFRSEHVLKRGAPPNKKDAYEFPFINLEDLAKTRPLLLLLNARGRNPPSTFALNDGESTRLGLELDVLEKQFANKRTMQFTHENNAGKYFQIRRWKSDDAAAAMNDSVIGMMLNSPGSLVIDKQQRLMRFLVTCCEKIMQDIPPDMLTSGDVSIPQPASFLDEHTDGFACLSRSLTEASYRVPDGLDLTRLESLFAARLSFAEDHFWALREDPEYFTKTAATLKEHCSLFLWDKQGRLKPEATLSQGAEEEHGQRYMSLFHLINDAYMGYEVWKQGHNLIRLVQDLQKQTNHRISAQKQLPEHYLQSILTLQAFLISLFKTRLTTLKKRAAASPDLHQFYVRNKSATKASNAYVLRSGLDDTLDKNKSEYLWALNILVEGTHDLGFRPFLVDAFSYFEQLVRDKASARSMTSGHMSDMLGELGLMLEGVRQMYLYYPWAPKIDELARKRSGLLHKELAARTAAWLSIDQSVAGCDKFMLEALGSAADNKFDYPSGKPRSEDVVNQMRKAEGNLDKFWSFVDRQLWEKASSTLHGWEVSKLPKLSYSHDIRRNPRYAEPGQAPPEPPAEEQSQEALMARMTAMVEHVERWSLKGWSMDTFEEQMRLCQWMQEANEEAASLFGDDLDPTKSSSSTTSKNEATRSTLSSKKDELKSANSSRSTIPQPGKGTVVVDSKALEVFHRIFYTPAPSGYPGEIEWKDLLHAMTSVGFTPEKLYGSLWHFHPTKVEPKRGIQLNEPRTIGKIARYVTRVFGRRLEQSYGWTIETFKLEEESA